MSDFEVLDELGRVIHRAPAPHRAHHAPKKKPKKKPAPRHFAFHAAKPHVQAHTIVRKLAAKHPTAPHHAIVAAVHRAAVKKASAAKTAGAAAAGLAAGAAAGAAAADAGGGGGGGGPDLSDFGPDAGAPDAGGDAAPEADMGPPPDEAPPESPDDAPDEAPPSEDENADQGGEDEAPAEDDSEPGEDAASDAVNALATCDDDLNGFFDFIAAPFKAVLKVVTAPVKLIEKIPVIGKPFHAVMNVAGVGLAERIGNGERIDHAVVGNFKDTLSGIHDLAPYAATIVSFVPGIGSGFAAAIAAGAALAEGKSINDALVDAVKGALPGGQLAATGFDAAWKIAHGANVSKVAFEEARANLPPAAQKAFDVGVALATGKSLQNAIVAALGQLAPAQAKELLDAGTHAIAVTKGLSDVAKHLANEQQRKGFQLAAGMLAHRGVNTAMLGKARGAVTGDVRKGFDALLHAQEQHSHAAKEALHGPDQKTRIANATAQIDPAKLIKTVNGKPALLLPATLNATTALIVADRAMRVSSGERGTPKQRKAMSDAIVWTNTLAQKKNADAARTLQYMALAKNVRGAKTTGAKPVAHANTPKKPPAPKHAPKPTEPTAPHVLVLKDGKIQKGRFKKVAKGTSGAVFGPLVSGRSVQRGYWVRA